MSAPRRLWALSDVHVNHGENLAALHALPDHGDDWLILAGDIGDTPDQLSKAIDALAPHFGRLLWVPGNHELWSHKGASSRGAERYQELVDRCRAAGVLTPEDPWAVWTTPGGEPLHLCLMFLLYDYTFVPDDVGAEHAVAWAAEAGIRCTDEVFLDPWPWPTRGAWCHARVAATQRRLQALPDGERTVLINHWPLRQDLVRLRRIPRFSPWCGTRLTEDWHTRYNAAVCVSGHLHMRATDWVDGVRFEEVSLGYPKHWEPKKGADYYLRQILPGPATPGTGTTWRFR